MLAFLKVILYSGNHTVQQGMKHLLTTREERLFVTMRALLQYSAITYKERSVYVVFISLFNTNTVSNAYCQEITLSSSSLILWLVMLRVCLL